MRQTTAAFRAAVAGWLQEEQAGKESTLLLLEALHAGAISGDSYHGQRREQPETYDLSVVSPGDIESPMDYEAEGEQCGCLVDTLEQIRDERPAGRLGPQGSVAFNLAIKIPVGGTPSNNVWARAAAEGIEDYFAAKGW